jgi:predicted DNA-binding antitoxin AbrB/MazE fold protein
MTTIEAIYEHGVFKPLIPLSLIDGQYVRIIVELFEKKSSDDILKLAAQVYEGLSEEDINDIEAIATDRQKFFRRK